MGLFISGRSHGNHFENMASPKCTVRSKKSKGDDMLAKTNAYLLFFVEI